MTNESHRDFICEDCQAPIRRTIIEGEELGIAVCLYCQWQRRRDIEAWAQVLGQRREDAA
jgi:hypothetical protein